MNQSELEEEIRESLLHVVAVASHSPPEAIGQEVELATYYLAEVTKRWKQAGMTRTRTRQKSIKAMRKRLREEGANQLRDLLGGTDETTKLAEEKTELVPSVGPGQLEAGEGRGPKNAGSSTTMAGPNRGAGEGEGASREVSHEPDARALKTTSRGQNEGLADANDEPEPSEVVGPPPGVGEDFAEAVEPVRRGRNIYTICKRCGQVQGRLVAGAEMVWAERCGECK